MIQKLFSKLRLFSRREDGTTTIEFVILFPLFLIVFMSGVEVMFVGMRYASLETAVDKTVRDIRLGTGTTYEHDQLREMICDRAGFVSDCSENLLLEMVQIDPREGYDFNADVKCTNKAEEAEPITDDNITIGQENDLMILRACAKVDPVLPGVGLGKMLKEDGEGGQYRLVAMTAFVQEPR